jgi:hypothetical protein
MKITIEIADDAFDQFYEKVREHRQMKNGRPVDRKAARSYFRNLIQFLLGEEWYTALDPIEIELYVDELDAQYNKTCPLYRMIKEHQPAPKTKSKQLN